AKTARSLAAVATRSLISCHISSDIAFRFSGRLMVMIATPSAAFKESASLLILRFSIMLRRDGIRCRKLRLPASATRDEPRSAVLKLDPRPWRLPRRLPLCGLFGRCRPVRLAQRSLYDFV